MCQQKWNNSNAVFVNSDFQSRQSPHCTSSKPGIPITRQSLSRSVCNAQSTMLTTSCNIVQNVYLNVLSPLAVMHVCFLQQCIAADRQVCITSTCFASAQMQSRRCTVCIAHMTSCQIDARTACKIASVSSKLTRSVPSSRLRPVQAASGWTLCFGSMFEPDEYNNGFSLPAARDIASLPQYVGSQWCETEP